MNSIVDTCSETCRALVNVFENAQLTFENDPRTGIKTFQGPRPFSERFRFDQEVVRTFKATGDSHEEIPKSLFLEPQLLLTTDNSVKITMITAVAFLVESMSNISSKIYFAASTMREIHFLKQAASQLRKQVACFKAALQ